MGSSVWVELVLYGGKKSPQMERMAEVQLFTERETHVSLTFRLFISGAASRYRIGRALHHQEAKPYKWRGGLCRQGRKPEEWAKHLQQNTVR